MPQIKLALSRGFAVSGLFRGRFTQGRRAHRFALALGYYRPPLQGFQFAASADGRNLPPKVRDNER